MVLPTSIVQSVAGAEAAERAATRPLRARGRATERARTDEVLISEVETAEAIQPTQASGPSGERDRGGQQSPADSGPPEPTDSSIHPEKPQQPTLDVEG